MTPHIGTGVALNFHPPESSPPGEDFSLNPHPRVKISQRNLHPPCEIFTPLFFRLKTQQLHNDRDSKFVHSVHLELSNMLCSITDIDMNSHSLTQLKT